MRPLYTDAPQRVRPRLTVHRPRLVGRMRLREKLGPAAEQLWTLRGVGYRFASGAAPARDPE